MKWLLIVLLLPLISYGASRGVSAPDGAVSVDTVSANITDSYDGANAMVLSGLASPTNLMIWNETGFELFLSFPGGTTCTGVTADHVIAPGITGSAAGTTVENISINKIVCARAQSGITITAGKVHFIPW